ncbi:hypothetical protein BD310DRAFT_534498 [Dichomitus squalens]|uniref:Uncharacterized protein n=1 Tax=Dichomitus squalens TaxID=114155 RepID=A0A4Q9PTJ1_9APHY|nr:hypothetical protein BD310DRAFT_534498 [Dichomitus squalens]
MSPVENSGYYSPRRLTLSARSLVSPVRIRVSSAGSRPYRGIAMSAKRCLNLLRVTSVSTLISMGQRTHGNRREAGRYCQHIGSLCDPVDCPVSMMISQPPLNDLLCIPVSRTGMDMNFSAMRYGDIIWTTIWRYHMRNMTPSPVTIIGAEGMVLRVAHIYTTVCNTTLSVVP